jgi:hypothetical protein
MAMNSLAGAGQHELEAAFLQLVNYPRQYL